ncbi:hypothetical protein JL722_950 [Aureococcus anophagefferens]|nr:hypothetical protein JL722_950 [Aureococcus anophagefferens]
MARFAALCLGVAAAQRCAPRAVLRLDVGGELALPLGPDAAGDGALVVDVVEAHGLAAGGGCGDAACVAGVLLDGVRRLRESLAALDTADAVLALAASSEPGARDARVYLGGEHQWSWKTTFPFPAFSPSAAALVPRAHATSKGGVTIGSDVFIGAAATILSGVTVGDGAVVGAAAVVAKDVRPYAVVVGNPAREIKRRFDDATVDALLAERWWTWDDATVAARMASLLAPPERAG